MSPHRFLLPLLFFVLAVSIGASDLHFVIHGVDSSLGGVVSAGVYASEEGYLEPGYEVAGTLAVVEGDRAVGVFTDLPPGRYVIAVLHDLDGDMLMKMSSLGLPKEGYGFSGTTRPVTIPPKYRKAAVELDGNDDRTVDVYMKY